MSVTIMKLMLILGIIGHAMNMYCDYILSVFPNGKLTLKKLKDIKNGDTLSKLMEGVSANMSVRSIVLEVVGLVLELSLIHI